MLLLSSDLNPIENEWDELKRSTNMKLWIWRIWRDSVWRNGLWSLIRRSPNSSGIIGENLELLSWEKGVAIIDLSVSPSPRTQTSQWQSSISCTGSGTRTSLGFSAIEKHWKIWSSHRFNGVYASKMEKRCACGTCNTDSRYLRGWAI